jgi:predicted nucleotidyltransferase component of viral defense system
MMINRQQLQLINRKHLRYPLDIAEKDYYLTLAMHQIASSSLGATLVFKGGTALHHCYLPQQRFSEDLDFTSLNRTLSLATVQEVLTAGNLFQIRKEYQSTATIKIERLWYPGILDQPGTIKVEIDRVQNVVLPPCQRPYNNVWGQDFYVSVMDIREICAEKIRAVSQRARYRDFYDLYLILDGYGIDLTEVTSLLQRKEIRSPITSTGIQANWQIARLEREDETRSIYCTRNVENEQITAMLSNISFAPILAGPGLTSRMHLRSS